MPKSMSDVFIIGLFFFVNIVQLIAMREKDKHRKKVL